jgi:tRNA nucleotidyltransferase (CCA-adding enzyme)
MDSVSLQEVLQRHPSLREVVKAADRVPVCLVGGSVRDFLLERFDGADVDVVVEGDAVQVAREAAALLGAQVSAHERFGTAEIHLPDGRWIDLVSARRETYPVAGALPVVTPGTLDDDLARRDITVNAMAIRLNGDNAGALVDPCDGRGDLAARLVRIMHPESFVDDPSRVLRVARYAARLDFALEASTRRTGEKAARDLDLTSARIAQELVRTLQEPAAVGALRVARRLGVPWIADPDVIRVEFASLDDAAIVPAAPHVPVWALRLGVAVSPAWLERDVAVDGWALSIARSVTGARVLAQRLQGPMRMSEVDEILRSVPPPVAVAARAFGADHVDEWWQATVGLDCAVTGHDLIEAGVAAGPEIGRGLAWLRAQVLDGDAPVTRDDQLAAVVDYIQQR